MKTHLKAVPGVVDVLELRVWTVGGHQDALTVRVQSSRTDGAFADALAALLKAEFDISYVAVHVSVTQSPRS